MKNMLIGLFVMGAVLILVSIVLFLDPKVGDGKRILKVRFANIAGISDGTRVSYAGRPVGEVISIQEIPDARFEHFDETGRIFCYLLTLKLDSSVRVFDSDEIAIRSTGLMGEKSIAILPKAAHSGKIAKPITNEILIANSIDPLENTFNQISKTANKLEGTLAEFNQWFKGNEKPLTDTISSLHNALARVDSTLAVFEQEKILPNLHQSTDLFNEFIEKASLLTDNLRGAAETFNTDGAEMLRNANQITRDIATGSGTLGQFIGKEDFYLRLSSLLSKAETMMHDINHYGLLFQYDKKWQRSRTKRANILKTLTSPKEFREYFETEMDTMNASLGRLTELLDKAADENEREQIVQNSDFKKQFATLMRQVEALSGALRLYNENLNEDVKP
ncbi:MAG: MCE family protein [Chlamydiia bacterium]|nr:MCE family protein [Chlamydiia bacterium]